MLMCVAGAAYDFGQGRELGQHRRCGRQLRRDRDRPHQPRQHRQRDPTVGRRLKLFNLYDWNTLLAAFAVAFILAATMWLFIDPRRTFYDPEPSC